MSRLTIVIALLCLFASSVLADQKNLTIDDFFAPATLLDMDISPNGRYLASIWYKEPRRILTIQDLEDPGFKVTGRISDAITRPYSISWVNNDRLIAHVSIPYKFDTAFEEMSNNPKEFDINDYRLYSRTFSMDIRAQDNVMLMNNSKRIRGNRSLSNIRHFLPKEPDYILMTAQKFDRLELYKVNVINGEAQRIARGGRRTFMFVNDDNGKLRFRLDYLRVAKEIEIYEYLDGDDDWELVDSISIDEEDDDSLDLGSLVGVFDDDLIYIKKNPETGFKEVISINTETKEPKVIVSLKDKDVLAVLMDYRSNEVKGYRYEDKDRFINKYFDAEDQKLYDQISSQIPHENFQIYDADVDNKHWILQSYSQNNPGAFYLYNFQEKTAQFYGFRYGNLLPEDLAISGVINYPTRDKDKVHSYLLLPPDFQQGTKYPLVVMPHGGPQSRDYPIFDKFAQFVATRGYIVVQPNFRGSTGYGRQFEEKGYGEWGGLMQDDLEDAVNFLTKHGYVDNSRVCIVGLSYGGYAALMGTVKTPDLYKCAVSMNGVTDLVDMMEYDLDKFEDFPDIITQLKKSVGDLDIDKDQLIKNSPLHRVSDIKTPIMVIAGDSDKVVPVEQSEDFIEEMEDLNKVIEFFILKDTGHNVFYYREDRRKVYSSVEKFLAKYLKAN